jgi:hypothetical protein
MRVIFGNVIAASPTPESMAPLLQQHVCVAAIDPQGKSLLHEGTFSRTATDGSFALMLPDAFCVPEGSFVAAFRNGSRLPAASARLPFHGCPAGDEDATTTTVVSLIMAPNKHTYHSAHITVERPAQWPCDRGSSPADPHPMFPEPAREYSAGWVIGECSFLGNFVRPESFPISDDLACALVIGWTFIWMLIAFLILLAIHRHIALENEENEWGDLVRMCEPLSTPQGQHPGKLQQVRVRVPVSPMRKLARMRDTMNESIVCGEVMVISHVED